MNPEPAEDGSPAVPTIEEERHFMAQCEYINRSLTAWGRRVRTLLGQRGWRSQWCREDQEVVWSKAFPDGSTQHLGEFDAYRYEEEQVSRSCEKSGTSARLRRKGADSSLQDDREFLAQCEELKRDNLAMGTLIHKLLCQRGWKAEWSDEEQEDLWNKTFPDGAKPCLNDNDAYGYEYRYARQFFRNTGIAIKPRKGQKPPSSGEQSSSPA